MKLNPYKKKSRDLQWSLERLRDEIDDVLDEMGGATCG